MLPNVRDGKELAAVKLPRGIAETPGPQGVHFFRPIELIAEPERHVHVGLRVPHGVALEVLQRRLGK